MHPQLDHLVAQNGRPVSRYGPDPRFRPERWNLRVHDATSAGSEHSWMFEDRTALPHVTVVADLHCATGSTSNDHETYGILTPAVLDLMPPAPEVTHHNGEPLTAEHGFPLRLVEPHLFGCKSPKWLRAIESDDPEALRIPLPATVAWALASAPRAKTGHGIRK
ncbi:molybdopterin-dependent oxidoreductase [Streptomyces sp. NPDC001401]|uniref:molybdopterin-dependent oxidoreductase n=1 Tax=Streptomyces sp. NPDC001401 TaxID=3364570 RepID=UPI00369C1458